MIANEAITAALRKLLVVKAGGTPTATQLADGLEVANDLISSWSAELNLTYEDTREDLTIPSGTQSITIGPSGTLTEARPLQITRATLNYASQEYPMRIMDEREYQRQDKNDTRQPYKLYYRAEYPNGTLYFESTTDREYTLTLTSMKELPEFPDGTTDVAFPAYYKRAFKSNLTIELADEFGAGNRITSSMAKIAEESKKTVLGLAVNIVESDIDLPVGYRYNINSDSL